MSVISIEWSQIRPWEGSQQKAFEELCCQLANYEAMPPDSRFTRKGAPDAGVECYWTWPQGEEIAWQAKFFQHLGNEQWSQLDESVKTALGKHPKLVKYVVCLPLDFPDARITDKKSGRPKQFAADIWSKRVEKWQEWAKELGPAVTFELWGQYEIATRLQRDCHRGRLLYWFQRDWFSSEWLGQRLDEAIGNANQRYLPDLHVTLDLEGVFEPLGRTAKFFQSLLERTGEIRRTFERFDFNQLPGTCPSAQALETSLKRLLASFEALNPQIPDPLPLDELAQGVHTTAAEAKVLAEEIEAHASQKEHEKYTTPGAELDTCAYNAREMYTLFSELVELEDYIESDAACLSNIPRLLLVGDAGQGKTHLFCSVAQQRQAQNLPTVLFLAEQFPPGPPWHHMIQTLGLDCRPDQFLGALNAAGEVRRARALIFIDGLNEEHGRQIWPKHLSGMLETLDRYPWVGLALSVRTSYEEQTIPSTLINEGRLIRFDHSGFTGEEEIAVEKYFAYHGIHTPVFPLLNPEFTNPLFLRVFCQGIADRELRHVPEGLEGFSAVFEFFIESVNHKLAGPDVLDYDETENLVKKALDQLVVTMIDRGSQWIERSEASSILNRILPREGYDKSLLRQLIDEGMLSEESSTIQTEMSGKRTLKTVNVIGILYQRFADHLHALYLLEQSSLSADAEGGPQLSKILLDLFPDESPCLRQKGLIEALAILVPERLGRELPEVVPHCSEYLTIRKAVAASLVWRSSASVSLDTQKYVTEVLLTNETTRSSTIEALLRVSTQDRHPLNAHFLHAWLFPLPLPERDALWSMILYRGSRLIEPVARLLTWAETNGQRPPHHFAPLTAIAITWLLTSSNRVLRDRATKALVSLCQTQLAVFLDLIPLFRDVNDLYVLERLLAAAYGCALRTPDRSATSELASLCYGSFFAVIPPVHVLARDYARGIIEYASLQEAVSIDLQRTKPPYRSAWPTRILAKEDLKRWDEWGDAAAALPSGLRRAYASIMEGDFASYILSSPPFLNTQLDHPLAVRRRETYDQFKRSLGVEQALLWQEFLQVKEPRGLDLEDLQDIVAGRAKLPSKPKPSVVRSRQESFEQTLAAEQREVFRAKILPYIEQGRPDEHREMVSVDFVQRLVFQYVLELGWDSRLDQFDQYAVPYEGRMDHRIERFGKKYQWLAYYRVMALLADTFYFENDSGEYDFEGYQGPWQLRHGRDIDPSVLLRAKPSSPSDGICWWSPSAYMQWDDEPNDRQWLKSYSDLPRIEPCLWVTDPLDTSCWAMLEGSYSWMQPPKPGRDHLELPQRRIGYDVQSYLVRTQHAAAVLSWLLANYGMHTRLAESRHVSDVFLGEYHWALPYKTRKAPYWSYTEWTREASPEELPHEVLVTAEEYLAEPGTYDASIDKAFTILNPSHWLVKQLGLRWTGKEGAWMDAAGKIAFRDPSVEMPGPNALLARRSILYPFLRQHGYTLIWTLRGTKTLLGGSLSRNEHLGRRLIEGAFHIQGRTVKGKIRSRLEIAR